jgi:hxlR-like helix-turn-helix domain-containing protein
MGATLRYHELQKEIPQATPKMLSQQLKGLEADGIIKRVLYPVVLPKTEYALTEFGKTLIPAIQCLCDRRKATFKNSAYRIPAIRANLCRDLSTKRQQRDKILSRTQQARHLAKARDFL